MNNQMLLVTWEDNWADECDFHGFKIMSQSDWNAYKKQVKNFFKENDYYELQVGTNEGIEYDSAEEFLKHFKTKKLLAGEVAVIKDVFKKSLQRYNGQTWFGMFPDVPFIEKYDDEENFL